MPASNERQNSGRAVPAAGGTYQPMDSGDSINPFGSALDAKKKRKSTERQKAKWKKAEKIQLTPTKKEKQKLENNEKKQSNRRKLLWILAGILGIVIIAVVIWAMVTLVRDEQDKPTINDVGSGDLRDYYSQLIDIAKENQDSDGETPSVEEVVKNTMDTEQGRKHTNELKLAEVIANYTQGNYEQAIQLSEAVVEDALSPEDLVQYYNALYFAYMGIGDIEQSNHFLELRTEASFKVTDRQ